MARSGPLLTETQWKKIAPLLPKPPRHRHGGRPWIRSGEKRGAEVGKTKRGKGTKWMVVVDGRGVPLGNSLHSASPSEIRLAEQTLAAIRRRH